ncbi:MAG: hypothetical protein RLZZ104_848 [Pseudomonadota bacterium]
MLKKLLEIQSVQIDRVIDVERGQKRKDIGLDRAHQQFEQGDADHQDERRQGDKRCNPQRLCIEAVDHKACENLHQNVTCCHCDEQSKREAERTDEKREQFDQRDQPQQPPGRAMRNKQAEEMEAMTPETDDQNGTKAEQREYRSDCQMAGHGKGMRAGNDTDGHHAHEVGEEDEHEQREYERDIFLALGTDARAHHVVDEASDTFDCHLPAARHKVTLHAASHENPDRGEHDQHEQRGVGEGNVELAKLQLSDRLNLELVHRIDFAAFACHFLPTLLIPKAPKAGPRQYNRSAQPNTKGVIPDAPAKSCKYS